MVSLLRHPENPRKIELLQAARQRRAEEEELSRRVEEVAVVLFIELATFKRFVNSKDYCI